MLLLTTEVVELNFLKIHARQAVAFFFLAILLIGFVTCSGYGRAWDDLSEMKILRMALKEYDALLPFDTPYSSQLQALELPRISESVERDHGICLYYPLFWAVLDDSLPLQQLTLIWRCHTWALFTLGLWSLYAIGRRMGFSRLFCCAGVLIMLLSPRFFAEGHFNNKDIPLMALTLAMLWQTARMMEKPTWKRGLGFALAAGFCAATRVIGVAFCGLFALVLILHLYLTKRLNRRTIGAGLFTAAASAALYLLLTPSFLAGPAAFIEYVLKNAVGFSRWHGSILYFGDVISCAVTKPPRSYLPVFIAITTPVWALALLGTGSICVVREACKKRIRVLAEAPSALLTAAFLGWSIPLLGCVALRALVYNGWRHLYLLYGPMVLCMSWGLRWLWQKAEKKLILRRALAAILCVCLLTGAAGVVLNHPYQYAYYNALVPAENRASLFEPDWWNLSCTNALEKLLAQTQGTLTVGASDRSTRSGLSLAVDYLDTDRIEVITEADSRTPQYLLANLGYAAIAGFEPDETMKPVVTIASYGAPVTVIYKLEGREQP